MLKPLHAYVCTNWNGAAQTAEAVASLPDGMIAVVVDNASTAEGEKSRLTELLAFARPVYILKSDKNLGYFAGLNAGLEFLRTLGDRWGVVIVGNNDLSFPAELGTNLDYLGALLRVRPVVAPGLIGDDGLSQNPHVIIPPSRLRRLMWALYHRNYVAARVIGRLSAMMGGLAARPEKRPKQPASHLIAREIKQGYGAVYLLGQRFLDQFGALPAMTFIMQEEFFLTELLEHHGSKVYFDPIITIRHHTHSTMSTFPARSRWLMERDAYATYVHYRSLSPAGQIGALRESMISRTEANIEVVKNV